MTHQERPEPAHWLRFEDVDGQVLEDLVPSDVLPEIGQYIPIAGTHCEVMEQWVDRALAAGGGPEVVVVTVRVLPEA
ncbi:MAG TPA: hypothetical protein VFW96_26535 [Thermomicrobiales bacterium]|nr:hypothetical protein [Thermomicrobiales bacterium]